MKSLVYLCLLMAVGCQCFPMSFVGLPCDAAHACPGVLRCEHDLCVEGAMGGGSPWAGGGGAGGSPAGGGGGTAPAAPSCDLSGNGGCDCLKIATLGYPGYVGSGDVFVDWIAKKAAPGAVSSLGATVLTKEVLARYQVVVVQDVHLAASGQAGQGAGIGRSFSTSEQEALREWVRNGGGLVTLAGYTADPSEVSNVNVLLSPFGLSYTNTVVLYGNMVTQWASHPIAKGISQVWFSGGNPVSGGTLIASQSSVGTSDVGRATEFGQGRVFSWGDEWISYSQSLSRDDCQVSRLWLNLLSYVTPSSQCQVIVPP